MAGLEIGRHDFWSRRSVFISGHTGFKGSWLSIWLTSLGARVVGYALAPPTRPSLFEAARLDRMLGARADDILDLSRLKAAMREAQPEIVLHLAAQPLVRDSYRDPVRTFSTNMIGTVNLFEAVRETPTVRVVVNVTTDKVYENVERLVGYMETDHLGGYDPYSASKACSEIISASYRRSFFGETVSRTGAGVAVATARAGNVIGGGDWASDRLVPDCLRAFQNGERVIVRNPRSVRPWQHVLEPLWGYLLLAEKLYTDGAAFGESWNFGSDVEDARCVEWIVQTLCRLWPGSRGLDLSEEAQPHEACFLKLDCSKAKERLHWQPRWSLEEALQKVVDWSVRLQNGEDAAALCIEQIADYMKPAKQWDA
jgi:CDP-glucose 4,6-dehydratase